jgi:threonine aldolase
MKIVDLRSDTVTLPTAAMRKAIADSELGDDVFGEDPTTNRLEELASDITGKEAALLVPSGTMGNLASILTHCARGEEAILGDKSHTLVNEAGGMSALGGVFPRPVPNQPDGTLRLEDIAAAIREEDPHYPRTRLICLENTQNICNGAPLSAAYTEKVAGLARERGLRLHLDGSRIFNAAVALGVEARALTAPVDSVTFCLSKGLSGPVGSVVCGSRDFIHEARRARKILGGAMRQCGIISAAGIVALNEMRERLGEDHENAKKLARGIDEIEELSVDVDRVRTNIVYFDLLAERPSPREFLRRLEDGGVRLLHIESSRFRVVTHYGIASDDIDLVLTAFQRALTRA